ncbi:MAG: hypothetical protein ACK5LC_14605, partial [Coprobacillaceae bacterium]
MNIIKKSFLVSLSIVLLTGCGTNKNSDNISNDDKEVIDNEETIIPERGIWEQNTFISKYSNITFKLPNNWLSSSDEAFNEVIDLGFNLIKSANFNSKVDEKPNKMLDTNLIYDAVAQDETAQTNIIIQYKKLDTIDENINMTDTEYKDVIKSRFEASSTYEIEEEEMIEISGESYYVLKLINSTEGKEQYCYL